MRDVRINKNAQALNLFNLVSKPGQRLSLSGFCCPMRNSNTVWALGRVRHRSPFWCEGSWWTLGYPIGFERDFPYLIILELLYPMHQLSKNITFSHFSSSVDDVERSKLRCALILNALAEGIHLMKPHWIMH